MSRSYSLSFSGGKSEIAQIVAFIDAHVGVSFLWSPPFGGQGYYQCDGYTDSNEGGDVFTIAATFQQTFQP